MITIVVGGDVYPVGPVQGAFVDGDARGIFGDLAGEFSAADLSIVNLECPLVSKETPILKTGPVFGASPRCIAGFRASRIGILNLANNHSYDHGPEGLRETMETAAKAGLDVVGAGRDLEQARQPLVKHVQGRRIAIYAMAEREFSQADRDTPGANPLDLIDVVDAIRSHKGDGAFIVLFHGGAEFYPYPSPEMRRRCRFMIDMGADAVICCHAHCPLPWEIYQGRPIVYGLGNLILEAPSPQPAPYHTGYLAKLTLRDSQVDFQPIPYVQSASRSGARAMDPAAREEFLAEMRARSARIAEDVFVESRWREFCLQRSERYLADLWGYRKWMWKMRRVLFKSGHDRATILRSLHLVQCETHREILNTIFKLERKGSDGGPSD
ncbi:MAG: Bacterial capsule synthesis protein cap [Candidatus Aminicenantes bacterium]|nr:Bacterial capsule synthesis protein cap [Candidatus Aminicenantes bacterium]